MTDTREPIAWMVITTDGKEWEDNHWIFPVKQNGEWFLQFPIYLPQQRTGNCLLTGVCAAEGHRIQKAQREWQRLTDEEIGDIIEASQITLKNYCSEDKQAEYARAIEAKLKEKNS